MINIVPIILFEKEYLVDSFEFVDEQRVELLVHRANLEHPPVPPVLHRVARLQIQRAAVFICCLLKANFLHLELDIRRNNEYN